MKVIRVEKGLFNLYDIIILEANKYEECKIDTLFGWRKYYVRKGTRVRLRFSKSSCCYVGDEIKLYNLITFENESKFDWDWY